MPGFPVPRWPPLNVITPWHIDSCGIHLATRAMSGFLGSQVATANLVKYVPFRLHEPAVARKMSYIVGSTGGGNVDIGIYDAQKNRLVNSGSVLVGTVATLQEIDIADTKLSPGLYFMAITHSSGTVTLFQGAPFDEQVLPHLPIYEETTGSFGLPDPANFAVSTQTQPRLPLIAVHFDPLI